VRRAVCKTWRPAALLLPALLSLWGSAVASGLPDTLEKIKPSILGVGTFAPLRQPRSDFRGTGWVVADGRHLITNYHVVSKGLDSKGLDSKYRETLTVFVPRNGKQAKGYKAKIRACDKRHDLCLLRMEGVRLPPLKLGRAKDVREGELHAITGYPIGMVLGLYPVTHQAIIASISPIAIPAVSSKQLTRRMLSHLSDPFEVFQLDAIAYPGNSGSPLYEIDTGRVVGVVNSVLVKGSKESVLEKPSGISYAIPVTHVYDLLVKAKLKP